MALSFGTDGVRGPAEDLTPAFVRALGRAAATVLGGGAFVMGRDTRASGPRIEGDLAAGLREGGAAVRSLGVCPTPAVAWVAARDAVAGAVISASHNPWHDNGIKLFGPGGHKLRDDVERALEAELDAVLGRGDGVVPDRDPAEPPPVDDAARAAWVAAVLASAGATRAEGLRVVVDAAHGALFDIAGPALASLGADVEVHNAAPDGHNINDGCGSTHPDGLQEAVRASGADLGFAFDGDADRVLGVDHDGRVIDGDQLIAMLAIDRAARGVLAHRAVVVTVMTNNGFRLGMAEHGIGVRETPVGDRHVLEVMAEGGYTLGGEQSGHIVFGDLATTGDGLLTAVQVLELVARSRQPLGALADGAMTRLPQVLRNVAVTGPHDDVAESLGELLATQERLLGTGGRILVRSSGTEPLVRVMVEDPDAAVAEGIAATLVAAVEERCR